MQKEIDKFDMRSQVPVRYRYNPWIRCLMLSISTCVIAYTLYFLALQINQSTPLLMKIIPFIILYVALDSIIRHLTQLNVVTFTDSDLILGFMAKKRIMIPYHRIKSIGITRKITLYLLLYYLDDQGKERMFKTNLSFPHMIRIMMGIEDMAPQISIDDKLSAALQLYRYKDAYEELRHKRPDDKDITDK